MSYTLHDHRGYFVNLALGGGADERSLTVSQVRRAPAQASTAVCADGNPSDLGAADLPIHGGILALSLADAAPALLGTRCAGPQAADLAHALAARRLAIRTVLRGARAIDFTALRSFAAHGFAGTVRSTVTLRLGHPQPQASNLPPPGRRSPSTRIRLVTVPFRVARVAGQVLARIAGTSEPDVCSTLDSCGLTGVLAVTPRAFSGTGQLVAYGPARRPYRDFLAALGLSGAGRRTGIEVSGGVQWREHGAVNEVFNQGSECRDSRQLSGGTIQLALGRGRLLATYAAAGQGADVLRTRCPGPQAANADLATGSLPLTALARGTLRIPLTTGAELTDDGYTIRTVPRLTVTLQRGRVTQQVLTEPGP